VEETEAEVNRSFFALVVWSSLPKNKKEDNDKAVKSRRHPAPKSLPTTMTGRRTTALSYCTPQWKVEKPLGKWFFFLQTLFMIFLFSSVKWN